MAIEAVFFVMAQEYEAWKRANQDGLGWSSKYYKGLGTSDSTEAREYFSELQQHELTFRFNQGDEELVDMAFSKDKAGSRASFCVCSPGLRLEIG